MPIKFEIPVEELRKRRLFIAAPLYGGQCHGSFMAGMMDLTAICKELGIDLKRFFLFNESLITRARNYCVDEFLRTDSTHLMFIDSDITFNAQDIIALMAMMGPDTPYDVMGAAYPKKSISWEKIKQAVNKGAADKDPNELEKFVGDYVFNPKNGDGIRLDEPAEVLEIGTGFMMIQRRAFDKYRERFPELTFRPDHVRSQNFDGSREVGNYFDCYVDPKTRRYLSEDYAFCQRLQEAGGKVWLCPWMELKHTGSYVFGGSLTALASIGASATADPAALGKTVVNRQVSLADAVAEKPPVDAQEARRQKLLARRQPNKPTVKEAA